MAGLKMCCFLVFCLPILIQITHSHNNSSPMICLPKKHAALFIFGDSLFDNGNNNYINTTTSFQANYPPYGETFFKYPSGRFSDGLTIPDYVGEFAKLPLLPPYLHPGNPEFSYGVNFASGGSGALLETYQGFAIDLHTQVRYFKHVKNSFREKLGYAKAETLVSKSIYLFSIGANDYDTLLEVKNSTVFLRSVNHLEFVDIVVGNLTNAIREIYSLGGRKFGFFNVGPLGCSPSIRMLVNNGSCLEEISAVARLHNNKLSEMLQRLEKQLKGFKYLVHDFYSAFSQVLEYPSKYGFKEGSVACCGGGPFRGDGSCGGNKGIKHYNLCHNVNEHLFFDSYHPTDRASKHFARLIWNGSRTITKPYNLKELFEF